MFIYKLQESYFVCIDRVDIAFKLIKFILNKICTYWSTNLSPFL